MDVINEVRVKNTIKVLDLIMRHGEISRVDLARSMDLTKTTISDIISGLIGKDVVREKRTVVSGLGRPATLLEMVPEVLHVIGIGVMRDRIEACLVNAQGKVLKQSARILSDNVSGKDIFDNLFSLIEEMRNLEDISAISVGISGPLDVEKGIVKQPPKFPDFENVNLTDILTDKYNVDSWIENDADVAALGEKWYGDGRQLDDFMYLFIDKGIGAGIIKDGNIYHGKNGYAGEIGHLLLPMQGEFKYLEDICGTDIIIEKVKKIKRKEMSIQEIGKKYIYEDKEIVELINEMIVYIGVALVSMMHMFGISDVFVGGKAVYFGERFLSGIREIVEKNLFYKHDISIRFSNLGDASMSMGAAVNGVRKYLKKEITI